MDITSTTLSIGESFLFGFAGRRSDINQVKTYSNIKKECIVLSDFFDWISSRSLMTYVEVISNPATIKGIKDRLNIRNFLSKLKSNGLFLESDEFWEIYAIDHKEQLTQVFHMSPEELVTIYEKDPHMMAKLEEKILELENREIIKS